MMSEAELIEIENSLDRLAVSLRNAQESTERVDTVILKMRYAERIVDGSRLLIDFYRTRSRTEPPLIARPNKKKRL